MFSAIVRGPGICSVVLAASLATPLYGLSIACAAPPGPHGTITCAGNDIPVCRAMGASFEGECLERASGKLEDIEANLLSHLLGRRVETSALSTEDYHSALRKGELKAKGATITFNLGEDTVPSTGTGDGPTVDPSERRSGEEPTDRAVVCRACVNVSGKGFCADGTGGSTDEGKQAAMRSLAGKLLDVGVLSSSKSTITCSD